jgi:PAS domain S-box-containing protein
MAQEHGAGRAEPAEVPEEYQAIFEAVTDGLIISDLATGRIVEVNPALCRMHGYQRDELIGSLATRLRIIPRRGRWPRSASSTRGRWRRCGP